MPRKTNLVPENMHFKIEVFAYDTSTNVLEELLEESLFLPYKKNKGIYTFELEDYRIKLPKNGFYVCIKSFRADDWLDINLNKERSPKYFSELSKYKLPPQLMYLKKIHRIQLDIESYVPKMLIKLKSPK